MDQADSDDSDDSQEEPKTDGSPEGPQTDGRPAEARAPAPSISRSSSLTTSGATRVRWAKMDDAEGQEEGSPKRGNMSRTSSAASNMRRRRSVGFVLNGLAEGISNSLHRSARSAQSRHRDSQDGDLSDAAQSQGKRPSGRASTAFQPPPRPPALEPNFFESSEDVPGERLLFGATASSSSTAAGVGAPASAETKKAIADFACPSSSTLARPVQVAITSYRLRLQEPRLPGARLHVTVCGGHDVKKGQIVNPSIYALVSVMGDAHRSMLKPQRTAVSASTNPVWNETVIFDGVESSASLRVELFDQNRTRQDTYIGEVVLHHVARRDGDRAEKHWQVRLPVLDGDRGEGARDPTRNSLKASLTTSSIFLQVGGTLLLRLRTEWPCSKPQVDRHLSIPLLAIEEAKQDQRCLCKIDFTLKTLEQFSLSFDREKIAKEALSKLADLPNDLDALPCYVGGSICTVSTPRPSYKFSWSRELERWAPPETYRERWCVDAEINAGYKQCASYCEEIILPRALVTDPAPLLASARFRTKGRFPMVAWVHPLNSASLVRCSQPKVGTGSAKATEDFAHDLECLMEFRASWEGEITICDARPYKNALANRLNGGGTETSLAYDGCRVLFLDIDNIHVMRDALHQLRDGVSQRDDYEKYGTALTNWFFHLHTVMKGAQLVSEILQSGESVVVHCSDGWDRTSQIVSLTSLILDGHYRTIAGLADLIEKDWLQVGHKFKDRNGLATRADQVAKKHEASPIFLQFLDCVAQIWGAYPEDFEYTPRLLSFLLYHSFSGRYANFLGNCEKERHEVRGTSVFVLPQFLTKRGFACLWSEVLRDKSRWMNPAFARRPMSGEPLSSFNVPLPKMRFSEELFTNLTSLLSSPTPEEQASKARDLTWTVVHSVAAASSRGLEVDRKSTDAGPSRDSFIFCDVSHNNACVLLAHVQACERILCAFTGVNPGFPSRPHVHVVSTSEFGGHTRFVVKLTSTCGSQFHHFSKRYSEFADLQKSLKAETGLEAPAFPQRRMWLHSLLRPRERPQQLLEARLTGLNIWFNKIVNDAWFLATLPGPGLRGDGSPCGRLCDCLEKAMGERSRQEQVEMPSLPSLREHSRDELPADPGSEVRR
eukprot:TRINITY_DN25760_c0_g1_i1.p1 TRINITY_DN25760_c0_g1~~TRINITY_DN25760_c0_g1_i1.p1  ORF type:complete len:1115 (+),score=195.12 TRINITY_DN25760_c0_g1_i1:90-3434(+)